jgi:hypothetical protein
VKRNDLIWQAAIEPAIIVFMLWQIWQSGNYQRVFLDSLADVFIEGHYQEHEKIVMSLP